MTIHSLKSFQIKFSMNKYLGNCAIYLNTILWLLHEVLSSDYTRRSANVTRLEADPVASSLTKSPSLWWIHSLAHSTNFYQLLIKCQSLFQAMGYTRVTKSGRSSYRKLQKNKLFLGNEVSLKSLRPEPMGHSTTLSPCVPRLNILSVKSFKVLITILKSNYKTRMESCPQTQQDLEIPTLEFFHPYHLVFLPPISTHHFSQGPTTSSLETVSLYSSSFWSDRS